MIISSRFLCRLPRGCGFGFVVPVRRKTALPNLKSQKSELEQQAHIPVMPHKVVEFMKPDRASVIVDMTFGAGGHARKLLEKSNKLKILCLDRDPLAISYAEQLKAEYPDRVVPLHGKFTDLPRLLQELNYTQNSLDGMFFDLGCSSMQFDDKDRGFSLKLDGPLDMRMDGPNSEGFTAADVLSYASEIDLQRILRTYGEETHARKIARAVIETRHSYRGIRTTDDLRNMIASRCGGEIGTDKMGRYVHTAVRVFLALRLFVNNELNELNYGMILARRYLKCGGVMVAITYHDLDGTVVKRHATGHTDDERAIQVPLRYYGLTNMHDHDTLKSFDDCGWIPLSKHAIIPTQYEADINPRSRNAKLRAYAKT